MKTIKELNEKAWYRFLKVLYVALIIPYIWILTVNGYSFFGELKNTYHLYSNYEDVKALALRKGERLLLFVIISFVYLSAMEFLRRTFYYVVIGKVFPKE